LADHLQGRIENKTSNNQQNGKFQKWKISKMENFKNYRQYFYLPGK